MMGAVTTLKELADREEQYMRARLNEGKSVGPMIFIHFGNTIFALPFKDPDENREAYMKNVAISGIREARKKRTFSHATTFSEAWVSTGKHLGPLSKVMRASQDPDRIEAVVMQTWIADGKNILRIYRLVRDGDKTAMGDLLLSNEQGFETESWLDPAFRPV